MPTELTSMVIVRRKLAAALLAVGAAQDAANEGGVFRGTRVPALLNLALQTLRVAGQVMDESDTALHL